MSMMRLAGLLGLVAVSGAASYPISAAERRLGFTPSSWAEEKDTEARFEAAISKDHLSRVHLAVTGRPHIAGSEASHAVAAYVREELARLGLETEIAEYEVHLSTPREVTVEILMPEPEKLTVTEPASELDPSTAHQELGPGFVAYSASAEVKGQVVYVNYGLPGDYAELRAAGVDVKGKVVLARYARSHRAVKVHTAEEAGAIGILIYSDPADDGYVRGDVWPEGPWRGESLLQRGNSKYSWFWHGDPLTPGVAARGEAERLDPELAPTLPRIPAAVLSSAEASKILRPLRGPVAPPPFRGGLPFTYHLGPGPTELALGVDMDAGQRTIRNVVGRLRGGVESDRWVLLGTHHDAWTFGGIDPGSATAVVLEVARGLAELKRSGWTPRRSILFAFWDAEEFGLVGSTEFAEDRQQELRQKAVCYINTDLYMKGAFDAGGVPSLRDFVIEVAKDIPEGEGTLYRAWREREEAGAEVELKALGSGADFVPFQDHLGLPTLSLEFDFPGSYGTYHSNYDTRFYLERFGDPGFERGAVLARVIGTVVMRLAAAPVLPFRYSHYAERIAAFLEAAQGWSGTDGKGGSNLGLEPLVAKAKGIETAARELETRIDGALDAGEPGDTARLNDALARLEQSLLDEIAPARERWYRHVIYGWNIYSLYDGQPLPGLAEAIRLRDLTAVARETERLAKALDRMRAGIDGARAAWRPSN